MEDRVRRLEDDVEDLKADRTRRDTLAAEKVKVRKGIEEFIRWLAPLIVAAVAAAAAILRDTGARP